MGSSDSKPSSSVEAELQKQQALLEAEKLAWQQQQIREQHWKEQQLREEKNRQEAQREWHRQAELRELQLEQQRMKKELEEQKILRQVEREKLLKELRDQRLQKEQLEKTRLEETRLQKEELENARRQKEQLENARLAWPLGQLQTTQARVSPRPSTTLKVRETVAVQQRATVLVPADCRLPLLVQKVQRQRQKNQQVCAADSATCEPVKTTPKSYVARMRDANVTYAEWSIINYVRDENSISSTVAANIASLLDDGNTVPFIARYKKSLTDGMTEEQLRRVRDSYKRARATKQRAVTIVRDIEQMGLWTPEFHALVHETKSLDDLEHIYAIFKSTKSKAATRADSLGLGIIAEACMKNQVLPLAELIEESVEGLKSEQQIRDGVSCLLEDTIRRDRRTFDVLRKLLLECEMSIATAKGEEADNLKKSENKYTQYYSFTSAVSDLKMCDVFAINRGETLKALSVKINIPEEFERKFRERCLEQYGFTESTLSLNTRLGNTAINCAYSRSIRGSVEKRVRKAINDRMQNAAIWGDKGLARGIMRHLLEAPVRGKVVVGISPGVKGGCKFAVVSASGDVLETGTIHPHDEKNPNGKKQARHLLIRTIGKHDCAIIALGSGHAAKETEEFLTSLLKDKNIPSNVVYTIVDGSAASIYSRSPAAALEFPGVTARIVAAVSIARRLQDPMAELVKIEPELLTADVYRQDVSHEQIVAEIAEAIVEAVSYVGVDANTASLALLRRVAGLDDAIATNIVEWRRTFGPFTNRNDFLKVKGMTRRIFEQSAGFLRIMPETAVAIGGQEIPRDLFEPLDQTWIHPEYYGVTNSVLEAARCKACQLGTSSFVFAINLFAQTDSAVLAKKFDTTAGTIEMIIEGLKMKKGQDERGERDVATFYRSIIRLDDLSDGDVLVGSVTHEATFGTFVEVGAEVDGLIHKTCMNGATVEVGQKVEVRVKNIDRIRGRLALTFIKCV